MNTDAAVSDRVFRRPSNDTARQPNVKKMRICIVLFEMPDFGGLEEFAATLAVSLKQAGVTVSVLSATWVPEDNQYMARLRKHGVPIAQVPKWLSLPASDWPTKERILDLLCRLLTPVIYLLGTGVFLFKRRPWKSSVTSARNWLRWQLTKHLIGPNRREFFARLLLYWWRFVWRPNILHVQGYTSNLLFVVEWGYANGIPSVYQENQTPDPQFDWWKDFPNRINKASLVVAVSDLGAEALHNVCKVTRPMIVASTPVSDPQERSWRKEHSRPRKNANLQVTTVARLFVTKGLTYLLDAIAEVKQTHPEVDFRVYGDGILRDELLAYAQKLGLNGNAIFVGSYQCREELDDIMTQTDIFAMSSIMEGQPLALIEAMAYGCPIITTKVGGISEIIHDGVNGLICEPRDGKALARGLRRLIEDPMLRHHLGCRARESYEHSPFQPKNVAQEFIATYDSLLHKYRAESTT